MMNCIAQLCLWALALLYCPVRWCTVTCRRVYYWYYGGARFWTANHGVLEAEPYPRLDGLYLCDFINPDGTVTYTLSRGGRVPTTGEHRAATRLARRRVLMLKMHVRASEGLGCPARAHPEASAVLALRAAGIGPLTDARPFELVGLVEALLSLRSGTLLPQVEATLTTMSVKHFAAQDVITF